MALADGLDRDAIRQKLFGGPAIFAPIRHHSPACAWALRAMIRAHRPEVVLIEAPDDLAGHIPHLLDGEARFPLAVVAVGTAPEDGGPRPATYLPFSDHAPETIAIREAAALGAVAVADLAMAAGAVRRVELGTLGDRFRRPLDGAGGTLIGLRHLPVHGLQEGH